MERILTRIAVLSTLVALACGGNAFAFPKSTGGGGSEAGKAPASAGKIQVEKAKGQNAYTVGEIFAKSGELDKKPVTVRGKVVKVSLGIMGKNWVHLQDGSGDAGKGTNDLVVTSAKDAPKVGDVVTASGTLFKDKDFGSGYKYTAIVEEGTFKP
jgi:hypothetical protein